MADTHDGGKPEKKELPYYPPQGPKGQMQQGPGNMDNKGQSGTQGRY